MALHDGAGELDRAIDVSRARHLEVPRDLQTSCAVLDRPPAVISCR
jgi:hypothetical protein